MTIAVNWIKENAIEISRWITCSPPVCNVKTTNMIKFKIEVPFSVLRTSLDLLAYVLALIYKHVELTNKRKVLPK